MYIKVLAMPIAHINTLDDCKANYNRQKVANGYNCYHIDWNPNAAAGWKCQIQSRYAGIANEPAPPGVMHYTFACYGG